MQISPQMRERHPEWPLSFEEFLNAGKPPPDPNPHHIGRSRWAELPGTAQAPARARAIVRDTLTDWGLPALAGDAEQLAAGLAAAAVEQPAGYPLGLSLREHKPPGQPRWIHCAVTDTNPRPTATRQPAAGTAIAAASGRDTTPEGTTTWFTLTSGPRPRAGRTGPERDRELEAGG